MRVVQFVQVVALLLLAVYTLLVTLQNPLPVRVPLLFLGREVVLPMGQVLLIALITGLLYAALLLLPPLLRLSRQRARDLRRRQTAERQLLATLQAALPGLEPAPELVSPLQGSLGPGSDRSAEVARPSLPDSA